MTNIVMNMHPLPHVFFSDDVMFHVSFFSEHAQLLSKTSESKMAAFRLLVCCVLLFFPHLSHSIPEPGKYTMTFDKDFEYRGFSKALYKDAIISAKGKCITSKKDSIITIQWKLKYTQCADYFLIQKDLINLWDSNRQYELTGTDRLKCKSPMRLLDHSKQQEHIELPTTSQKLNSTAKTLESKLSTIAANKRQNTGEIEGNDAEDHDSVSTKTNNILTRKGNVKKKSGGIKGQSVKKKSGGIKGQSVKKKSGGIKGQTQGRTSRIRRAVEDGSEDEQETTKDKENDDSNSKLLNEFPENPVGQPHPEKSKRKQSNSQTDEEVNPTGKEENTATAITTENILATLATDHQVDSDPSKKKQGTNRIATTRRDGIYMLIVTVVSEEGFKSLELEVAMESKSGFLSATDWPLLPFFGVMSLVYLFYGLVWLIVSACQWRDLLRIQFWIGGVIALGMLEKAVFYSEYNNINHTGIPTPSLVVFAEVVSVAKRTLARMLVIIVSMGFGIVKPRLGKSLHRVLGVGALYFVLAIVEGSMRSLSLKADPSKEQLVAGIPLAVLDAAICWWIFMSLVQTTRTLRIRRNVVKLSLYRHFTNTLIFAVLASVAYMIWSIKTHRFAECLKDWSELWLDEAFWHFLFSIILLVIMVLWRPTANNQRYAFTPIVDFDDDDEQDNVTLSEAFDGMKMRNTRTEVVINGGDAKKKAEDDLKWVEEHIPSSAADTVLPSVLDSDEELMTTKFEMSKMD